uniref:UPAR/Ly6 domain-containing protein n=1 Tax=Xenopus tropicalis TaxID=8364 RepID=A0A6I8RFS5_XENTR
MWEYSPLFAAVPLKCYTCTSAPTNAECLTLTTCRSYDAYCETVVSSSSGVTTITKSCTPSCTPGSSSIARASGTISCCKTDLCNISGATGVKYSYPALGLPLGSLLVLLRGSAL